MRFFLALVVVILSFQLRLAVREQDSLFTTEKSGSFREHAGFMMHPGFENRPVKSLSEVPDFQIETLLGIHQIPDSFRKLIIVVQCL